MEVIPDELKKRWAERERLQAVPEIATIDLVDHEPLPPELDFLDEWPDDPVTTEMARLPTEEFHGHASPWIDPLQLHGTHSVTPGIISIAGYVPQ